MAIGETLKNAREALGLSHKDVAESTHMMTQMVVEIEDDDYHRFTAPVYGKGFIKLFAKAVGLDPAPLIAEFLANPEGNADQKKKKKTVALVEKILTEPRGDSHADEPEHNLDSAEPTPPPPPRHTYARASTVTLPTAHSPYAINTQNPPPPRQPVPPASAKLDPVKPRVPTPSEDGEMMKPRSTADDMHNASTFKLEAGSVAVPPQPVAQAHEPFKFPSAIKRPSRVETEEEPERPVQTKKPTRRKRDDDPERPSIGDTVANAFKHVAVLSANALNWIREKFNTLFASDDDEESRIRKRYILTGFLVFLTVVAVIVIASNSSGPKNKKDKEVPVLAANEVAEPVIEDPVGITKTSEATETPPAPVPTPPVEIVRVMPPPRMFAK